MDVHWHNERDWMSWVKKKEKSTWAARGTRIATDTRAWIELRISKRVTRVLTHDENRWCQAEGHHRLRYLRQPPKPLCRRCPRCHLQHFPPHQGPDLLLAPSHAGRLLPAELGHREVRLSNCNEEKLDLTLEIETTTSTPRLAVLSLPTRRSKMVHKVTCVGLWASRRPSVYQRLDQVKKNRNGWLYE